MSKTQHQVTINGNGITHVIYKDQPVLTFAMIDQVHQRPEATARKRFNDNVTRFIENEDFYLIDYSQKSVLRTFGINIPPRGLTVLTQSGYAMLAKVFTDDLAWQVQRELVNKYFAIPQTPPQPTPQTLAATPDQNLVNGMFLINASADALRISTDSRLKLLHNLTKEHGLSKNLLPDYCDGRRTKALATLLKEHGAGFGAAKGNKFLFTLGIIEKQTRPSTKKPGEMRDFWSITELGLEFGKNLVSPNNPRETQPHYYADSFLELLAKINSYLRGSVA